MSADAQPAARVIEDAALLLRTIRDEIAEGRRPYSSDVRRLIERGLALRFAEYVQFLERYGFLTLDRRTDLLELTRAGRDAADGQGERLRSLSADATYHFGDRVSQTRAEGAPVTVPGSRFDKRYLRYESIGGGGFGTVWRGRLLSVDRPVAIKTLQGIFDFFTAEQHPELIRRLELAVRDHARLVSPFVIQILDQHPGHEVPYFVMELATGGNLRGLLEGGPLPPPVAVRYFVQIALGLRAAHQHGLLHRDLKPENVLLDQNGNVKLSDFGITRVVERDGSKIKQAYVGFGSVGYMAPEMFRRGVELTAAVDVYALGILLYEMLVGELPGRRSPMPSEVVPGVPKDLDDIFDSMTRDDPERRPADLDRVLTQLWTSQPVTALLDARQAPFFSDPPVSLPGLARGEAPPPEPSPRPEPSAPPAPRPAPEPSRAPAPRSEAPVARVEPPAPRPEPAPARIEPAAPKVESKPEPVPKPEPAPRSEPAAKAEPSSKELIAPPAESPAPAKIEPPTTSRETPAAPLRSNPTPVPAPVAAESGAAARKEGPSPRAVESEPLRPVAVAVAVRANAGGLGPAPTPVPAPVRAVATPPAAKPVAAPAPEFVDESVGPSLPFESGDGSVDENPDDSLVDEPDPALFAEAAERMGQHTSETEIEDVGDADILEDDEDDEPPTKGMQTDIVDTRRGRDSGSARKSLDDKLKKLKKK